MIEFCAKMVLLSSRSSSKKTCTVLNRKWAKGKMFQLKKKTNWKAFYLTNLLSVNTFKRYYENCKKMCFEWKLAKRRNPFRSNGMKMVRPNSVLWLILFLFTWTFFAFQTSQRERQRTRANKEKCWEKTFCLHCMRAAKIISSQHSTEQKANDKGNEKKKQHYAEGNWNQIKGVILWTKELASQIPIPIH